MDNQSSSAFPRERRWRWSRRREEGREETQLTDLDQTTPFVEFAPVSFPISEKNDIASSTIDMSTKNTVSPSKEAATTTTVSLKKSTSSGSASSTTAAADVCGSEVCKKLHLSIWPMNNFDLMKDLLKLHPDEIHGRFGVMQETLLHRACRYGNTQAFEYLCSQGAVLASRNKCGNTPLHLACLYGRIDFIKDLVEAGVPLDETDDFGDQAIHFAAKSGCFEAIKLFVEKGVAKCVKGFHGNSIVHYSAKGGQMELLSLILSKGCNPDAINELKETPLHFAAGVFTMKNNKGVDIINLLLSNGASLNSRTHWGDTAAHYAGLSGSPEVLELLIDKGIEVDKNKDKDHSDFYEKHQIPREDRSTFNMSLLQKVAKSGCQFKAHIILERIMSARNKLAKNMYYESRGTEFEQCEMNNQEMSFLHMCKEMMVNSYEMEKENNLASGGSGDKKEEEDGEDKECALLMFLKYSPDSLTRLFDLCVVKPCFEQIQGRVYFDFFLFNPMSMEPSATELSLINTLIIQGKERFLIHPLFETFLKIKWYKTWLFYLLYILADFIFLISLSGYTLAHFGQIYEGYVNYDYRQTNVWWILLAVCHGYMSIIVVVKTMQIMGYCRKFAQDNPSEKCKSGAIEKFLTIIAMTVKDFTMPTLIGLVLYGSFDEEIMRYFLAVSVILASYQFMTVISRLPRIGLYVHMLTKVMMTVLNFFASYFWHFLGYAIAFHILLPYSVPFNTFVDSFIKVIAMLMGEYEYTINFVSNPHSSYMARVIFVIFVVDMSVVLMNLVLGLAISDIEELQRNSAVRRMMQESCTVMFMENMLICLGTVPCFRRFFCSRITSDKTCLFVDVTYLDLVDLDKASHNCLVLEKAFPESKIVYKCPNHIVNKVVEIIKGEIFKRRTVSEATKVKQQHQLEKNQEMVLGYQKSLMEKIEAIQGKLGMGEEKTTTTTTTTTETGMEEKCN